MSKSRDLLLLHWWRYWKIKVPLFSGLRSSRFIKCHNITLPKNIIFPNQPVINGNVDCKERCGLDRIHSLERSKRREKMGGILL
jgi:hypothetical protein